MAAAAMKSHKYQSILITVKHSPSGENCQDMQEKEALEECRKLIVCINADEGASQGIHITHKRPGVSEMCTETWRKCFYCFIQRKINFFLLGEGNILKPSCRAIWQKKSWNTKIAEQGEDHRSFHGAPTPQNHDCRLIKFISEFNIHNALPCRKSLLWSFITVSCDQWLVWHHRKPRELNLIGLSDFDFLSAVGQKRTMET